jgi:hypothetical protein
MIKLLSLEFEYKGAFYYALIRVKEGHGREYHITVMNGELERILYGNHIIPEVNGRLQVDVPAENNLQGKLKLAIAHALREYLKNDPGMFLPPDAHQSHANITQ